jgi:hypothetical protein
MQEGVNTRESDSQSREWRERQCNEDEQGLFREKDNKCNAYVNTKESVW